MLLKET